MYFDGAAPSASEKQRSPRILRPRVPQKIQRASGRFSLCNISQRKNVTPALRHPETYKHVAAADLDIMHRKRAESAANRRKEGLLFLREHEVAFDQMKDVERTILKQLRKEEASQSELRRLGNIMREQGHRTSFDAVRAVQLATKRLADRDAAIDMGEAEETTGGTFAFSFPLVFMRLQRLLKRARARIAERRLNERQERFTKKIAKGFLQGVWNRWREELNLVRRQQFRLKRRYFDRIQAYRGLMLMQRRRAWAAMERSIAISTSQRCFYVWRVLSIASNCIRYDRDVEQSRALKSLERNWPEFDSLTVPAIRACEEVSSRDLSMAVSHLNKYLVRSTWREWRSYTMQCRKEHAVERRYETWVESGKQEKLLQAQALRHWHRRLMVARANAFFVSRLESQCLRDWRIRYAKVCALRNHETLADRYRDRGILLRSMSTWATRFRDRVITEHLGTVVVLKNRTKLLPYAHAFAGTTSSMHLIQCFSRWRVYVRRRKAFATFSRAQHMDYCKTLLMRALVVWRARGNLAWETGLPAIGADDLTNDSMIGAVSYLAGASTSAMGATTFINVEVSDSSRAASPNPMRPPSSPYRRSQGRSRSATMAPKRGKTDGTSEAITTSLLRHPCLTEGISILKPTGGSSRHGDWSILPPLSWIALRHVERQFRAIEPQKLPSTSKSVLNLSGESFIPLGRLANMSAQEETRRRRIPVEMAENEYHDGGFLLARVCQALVMNVIIRKHFLAAQSRAGFRFRNAVQENLYAYDRVSRIITKVKEEEGADDLLSEASNADDDWAAKIYADPSTRSTRSDREALLQSYIGDRKSKVWRIRKQLGRRRRMEALQRLQSELPPEAMSVSDIVDVPRLVKYLNAKIATNTALLRAQMLHDRFLGQRYNVILSMQGANIPPRPPKPPPRPKRKPRPLPSPPKYHVFGQKKPRPKRPKPRVRDITPKTQRLVASAAQHLLKSATQRLVEARPPFNTTMTAWLLPRRTDEDMTVSVMGSPDKFDAGSVISNPWQSRRGRGGYATSMTSATSETSSPAPSREGEPMLPPALQGMSMMGGEGYSVRSPRTPALSSMRSPLASPGPAGGLDRLPGTSLLGAPPPGGLLSLGGGGGSNMLQAPDPFFMTISDVKDMNLPSPRNLI